MWPMCVSGYLWPSYNSLRCVLHELICGVLAAIPNVVRDTKLRIRINSRPRPNVSPPVSLLLQSDVLFVCSDEAPDFIAVQTANTNIADMRVMVRGASTTRIH